MNITHKIDKAVIEKAFSYQEYAELIDRLLKEGRTTNDNNSESYLGYTRLSLQRMDRWNRKGVLSEELRTELNEIECPQIWLVLTEGWCGDAGQIVPFFNKMASESERIELRFLLRDQHDEIMDQFLTNGSRSIPKLIILGKENLEILDTWGPRPKKFQDEYMARRNDPLIENAQASKDLHLWYARDKGAELQKEMVGKLRGLK